MADQKMHQTTVRFGADLWEALEVECAELGVSIAQFVRESALARLMYMAGRRGELDHETAFALSSARQTTPDKGNLPPEFEAVASLRDQSAAEVSQSSALWAQGRLARRRAQELRDASERRRLER